MTISNPPEVLMAGNQDPSTTDRHILHKSSGNTADLQHNPAPNHPQNPQLTSHQSSLKSDTFWTLCNRCSIRYEYPKMYLNQKLMCHHCQHPFMAMEMLAQSKNVCSPRPCPAMVVSKDCRSMQASSTRAGETGTMIQPPGQSPNGGDEALEKYVIALEKVDASSNFNAGLPCLKGEKSSTKRGIDGPKGTNKGSLGAAGSQSGRKRTPANLKEKFGTEQVLSPNNNKPRGSKELSVADICSMLMEKARTEIISELKK